ncbi:hypothetical protein [Urechidicola vernalis]|uniref:Uncharacterized protein n=1 Tax=Urechidicola vernalis TaxID=3075600 RepID=A0ABU2Y4D6_9FLAO|nr:hypothetical protein [Urechidicola sp. P050]MDT0553036.1 hypothetical protein [Urechidicola sp. P050]
MKNRIPYLIISVLLIIIGFLTFNMFNAISFSKLNTENLSYVQTSLSNNTGQLIWYTLGLGALPFLLLITKKIAKIESYLRTIIVSLIIFFGGFLFWQIKILTTNSAIKTVKKFSVQGVQNSFDVSKVNFSLYLTIGFLLGTIISIIVFKFLVKKSSNTQE